MENTSEAQTVKSPFLRDVSIRFIASACGIGLVWFPIVCGKNYRRGVDNQGFPVTSCTNVDRSYFEIGCLVPSLLIILVLAFLKRRESSKLSCCNGYPGLVIPINFLRSSESNRFVIAAAFGATASACLDLALISDLNHVFPFPKKVGPWLKVFQGLLAVLMYAILFYPYFACLTTKHKLIGSLMGFVYTTIRFPLAIVLGLGLGSIFRCGNHHDIKDTLKNLRAIGQLPMLCCLLFIMVRFAVLLGIQVRKHWFSDSSCGICRATVSELDEDILLNGSTEIEHVSRLLNLKQNKASSDVKGLRKLLHYIYQPRSDFKFSTQFLSTLLVAGIALFEIAVALLILTRIYKERFDSLQDDFNRWKIVIESIEASCVLCFLVSALLLLHFMKCHRDHVFQQYRGERFCQDVAVSPTELVGQSLCFSGCQIAYAIIGYLTMFTSLLLISLIGGLIVFFKLDQQILAELLRFILGTLPTLVLGIVSFLFKLFLKSYVFRDRNFPNITITVANRQVFSIASYFFFFFNIIVRLISGVFRLLKALLLGIVFMSRIDRTSLMQGYQSWDGAFLAYVGFLNVLVAHSHPVMLVFCHLLINRNSDRALEEPLEGTSSEATPLLAAGGHLEGIVRQRRVNRFSQKAANRWLLAVMLLRNPSLRKYRRQGRVTRLLDMRSNRINSTVIIRI